MEADIKRVNKPEISGLSTIYVQIILKTAQFEDNLASIRKKSSKHNVLRILSLMTGLRLRLL